MNIQRAKQEDRTYRQSLFGQGRAGRIRHPGHPAAPHPADGPSGIGKTQIMEQAARECGVALVAYTITHHTRQSAGPALHPSAQLRRPGRLCDGVHHERDYRQRLRAKMEATGLKEGILFIDEINCVSETLAPTMLQFLQCKTFGNQAVLPAGWVIVAAGNPPEYNKSVRDFDIVTLDRVRRMDIEPDAAGMESTPARPTSTAPSRATSICTPELLPDRADVDGTQFVTARGWEDLSNLLDTYEALGLKADESLIRQYPPAREDR